MELLSKYRRQLFGISALMVIAVHFSYLFVDFSVLYRILLHGGTAVYVFALLSGMGLFFSLAKAGGIGQYSKKEYYKRRFIRLLLPYLLISCVWYGIRYIIFEKDIFNFLYELSTLSFWIENDGAWYVAMLIPAYAVFPLYFDWIERGKRGIKTISVSLLLLLFYISLFFISSDMFSQFWRVLLSYILICIGNYIGKPISEGKRQLPILFFVCLVIVAMKVIPVVNENLIFINISYASIGIVFAFVFVWILDKLKLKVINNFFAFFGDMSLELYLTNIYIIHALKYFNADEKFNKISADYGGYIQLVFVFVLGVLISCITMLLIKLIIKRKLSSKDERVQNVNL